MSMISEKLRKARQGVKEEDSPAAQALRLAAYGAASGRLREQEEKEAQGLQSLRLAAYGAATGRGPSVAELRETPFKAASRSPAGMVTDSGTGTSVAKQEYEAGKERARYLDFSTGAELQRRLREAEDALSLSGGGRAEDAAARALKKPVGKISAEWPRQAEACRVYIDSLSSFEKKRVYDLDRVAGLSGTALGEIFVMREDEWSPELRKMGFYLGKFVYLMDAYEDLEKDIKKGRYNPWEPYADNVDFDATAENVLTMMMVECAKQFEKLPIVQDIDILRNIIYSGVWMKYAELKRKKEADDSRSL